MTETKDSFTARARRNNFMEITSLEIRGLITGGLMCNSENAFHQKILPNISVVQSIVGSYNISIDNSETFSTGEMGVFVAPSGKVQKITHFNGADNYMKSHWVFMDPIINRQYPMDDVFDFPTVLPSRYNERIYSLIDEIAGSKSICRRYCAAYMIAEILLEVGISKPNPDKMKLMIQQYVLKNYSNKIKAEDIAAAVHCSVPQLFRYTKKYFALSPANYVNYIRLQNAAKNLESTGNQIKEIAISSGFDDTNYFSKLFKQTFGIAPSEYRQKTVT